MGLKGELGDGFPQLKPAFIWTIDWDAYHQLGPTTHPKNHLGYVKWGGTVKSVPGNGLPPLEAKFVDAGSWVQHEVVQPSGETWLKYEGFGLMRVVEPPNAAANPAVAEMETGLIRVKLNVVGNLSSMLQPTLEKNIPELIKGVPKVNKPGHMVATYSFETGDPRYKYLEHAVYVGQVSMRVVPAESSQEGQSIVGEVKLCYLAA